MTRCGRLPPRAFPPVPTSTPNNRTPNPESKPCDAPGFDGVADRCSECRRRCHRLRGRIGAAGREPGSVAILPGLVTYVGPTEEEARAKKAELDSLLDTDAAIAQLGVFTGQDYTSHDLDVPVADLPPVEQFTGPQGRYTTVQRIIETRRPTLRELLGYLAAGGGHATMIGTPESIADRVEEWFVAGACDGFNLMCPAYPDSLDDFVDLVVPDLQRRSLFRTAYPGRTLRDTLGFPVPAAARPEPGRRASPGRRLEDPRRGNDDP
ncbi:LLM class flavin-dependent oxidoreductase [Rhodococcus xishaensis]|uniref:LLM class flavin-dependent oxidoreductase n=1 Tax=Rhodococcus xishaensis TaxID=2487364 RepID=A0A438AP85_9NOCA|nr:LLM class flavin-dependent oxidoreductase [Rhodococcus xishaensis]